jgi:hypothetical protein
MTDPAMLARRGAHAEGELCRLIGAILSEDACLTLPAIAALPRLPVDLSDIGGLPQLAVEIMRADGVHTADGIVLAAMKRRLDVTTLRLGSFLCECMDTPSFQPENAAQSVVNFTVYCEQLRAVERLQDRAWAGRRIPELLTERPRTRIRKTTV